MVLLIPLSIRNECASLDAVLAFKHLTAIQSGFFIKEGEYEFRPFLSCQRRKISASRVYHRQLAFPAEKRGYYLAGAKQQDKQGCSLPAGYL
jgi:hypothetical protein